MTYKTLALGTVLLSGLSLAAVGYCRAEAPPPPPPPMAGTHLSFVTEGEAHAAPTRLTVHLSAHAEDPSPVQAQEKLNRQMGVAMHAASDQKGVDVQAGHYSVSEDYNPKGPKRWDARQEMTLSGTDSAKLLTLAGQMQKLGLNIDGLDWSLDPKMRETMLRDARHQALEKVRAQAEDDAKILGLRVVSLRKIQVIDANAEGPAPRSFALMAERAAAPVAPQGTPGVQSLRVSVSVDAQLMP